MGLEQRGRVRRLHERNNWKQEDLDACDKLPDGSRVRRELYARFCERLGVRLPGPTHPFHYYEDLPGRGWRYLNVSPSAKAPKKELNRHPKGWKNYFDFGYPRAAFEKINSYVRERLTQHLRRRSQRPFRPPEETTYYEQIQRLGLVSL